MNLNKNIVILANCQGRQIAHIMKHLLPDREFNVEWYSNNSRTGSMKSKYEVLDAISCADIFIYQPLKEAHGYLSEKYLLSSVLNDSCTAVSFAYIFNSGIYSLCHAPFYRVKSYGKIFCEKKITKLINNHSKEQILQKYKEQKIDFHLIKRFNTCLEEMKKREQFTTIKLSDFILHNYKYKKLFITHNHPSNLLFGEILKQVQTLIDLPFNLDKIKDISELENTNSPISPYDVKIHDYRFQYDKDWYLKGKKLIEKILNEIPK